MNSNNHTPLSEPLDLQTGAPVPNRLVKAAMTEGLADPQGLPTKELEALYRRWSEGGVGLLITGNVQIDRQHLERPGNVIIDHDLTDSERERFTAWSEAAKSSGSHVWMQISHAGRQTQRIVNPHPKAPSPVRLRLSRGFFGLPVALTDSEIIELIDRYALAAKVAKETGFNGVQIHAAHGYLLSQFLAPDANKREDRWGGSLENRARMLLEVVQKVRDTVGNDFVVAVKINSADFQRGGFGAEDSITVAQWLEQAGIDVLEISGGNYENPRFMNLEGMQNDPNSGVRKSTAQREAYFLDFATQLQESTKTPLMVTGGFRSADAMASAIADDGISLIGLARPLCVDPDYASNMMNGGSTIDQFEDQLRLGPGPFGPNSSVGFLRSMNLLGTTQWYYQQIRRMGNGQDPDRAMSVFGSFMKENKTQMSQLLAAKKANRG
jgi:2,4-dienoyl-CoA reductase-like NADH-dependent reductase (Old Yellow Enzyme family)